MYLQNLQQDEIRSIRNEILKNFDTDGIPKRA